MDRDSEIRPFRIEIPHADLDHLRDRLARTRWPDQLPGVGWDYGIPLEYVRELAKYWRTGYDWRVHEARLNAFDQFTFTIDGQRIHFLHVRSAESGALPLIITHGWPGSIVEFLKRHRPADRPRGNGYGVLQSTRPRRWPTGSPTHRRVSWPGSRRSSASGPTTGCPTRRSTATSFSPTSRCTG